MSGTTKNYGLIKPTVGGSENEWGGNLNADLDDIDGLLGGDRAIQGINIESGSVAGVTIDGTIGEGGSVDIHPDTQISGKVKRLEGMNNPDGVITNCDIGARELSIGNSVTENQHTIGGSNNVAVLAVNGSMQYMPSVDPAQVIKLTIAKGQSVTLAMNWADPDNPPAIDWQPQQAQLVWVGGGSPNINQGINIIQFWCMDFGFGPCICGAYTGVVS